MKKVISILLAAACLISLCACGDSVKKIEVSAKDLTAAAMQAVGLDGADLLSASDDESFKSRFYYYYGITTDQVRDYAIAYSSVSRPEEISVLVAADGVDVSVLTDALDNRRKMQPASFALYSPESVKMLEDAIIFTEGDCAVLIVAENAEALRDKIRELISDAETTEALAKEFYAAHERDVPEKQDYNYSKPVPESEAAKDETWFKDAAFVGDSRMKGLLNFTDFDYAADFSYVGLNVADVFTKPYVTTESGSMMVSEALRGGTYGKIYIMSGINELGWYNLDKFIEYYGDLVELAKQEHPEAQIYIISILPLGAQAAEEQEHLTNERAQMFNELILNMCSDKQVYYIDGYDALAANGQLPEDASPDGVHLNPNYCKTLIDYLLSHTVEK